MENARVSFEGASGWLSVRRFRVEEQMHQLFRVSLLAVSPSESLDLSRIVGHAAHFVLSGRTERSLRGLCRRMAMVRTPTTEGGLTTYELEIVPTLWRLTQRRNNRLFQHITTPEIVTKILSEHGVHHAFRIDQAAYPRLELRTQYGETDLDFVSRLLEEAGITFFFEDAAEGDCRVLLTDAPQAGEMRAEPLPFVDEAGQAAAGKHEHVTRVVLAEESRPGAVTLRDHDMRRPRLPLFETAQSDRAEEASHEQYHHAPGSFLRESFPDTTSLPRDGNAPSPARSAKSAALSAASRGAGAAPGSPALAELPTPVADDRGTARIHADFGQGLARRMVEALHADRRTLTFETNAPDLRPGTVLAVTGHPRADISGGQPLLMTHFRMEGELASPDAWVFEGKAVFAGLPYRPPMKTPKPRIHGLQSAVVVGPGSGVAAAESVAAIAAGASLGVAPGTIGDKEIYVDELGRVRVQFNWDREGRFDGGSSMWMRVSQGWAGSGYGMFTIPRVGQEVLVAYLDGDPDCPIVVGRVHNAIEPVPYKLPENATVSTIKTSSSPGGQGFNELRFDDAAGREHVYVQAQRDMDHLVKRDHRHAVGRNASRSVQNDDALAVGHDRTAVVNHNDVDAVGLNRATVVGVSRATTVGVEDSTQVGTRWSVTVARGLTSRLAREVDAIAKGPLAGVLRGAATRVLGGVPESPLADAAAGALASFGGAAIGALKNVLSVLDGFEAEPGPPPTSIEMVDRQIKLSTGEASILLDGPNVTIAAQGAITLHAMNSVTVLAEEEVAVAARERAAVVCATGDVIVQAKKNLHLNPYDSRAPVPPAKRVDGEGA